MNEIKTSGKRGVNRGSKQEIVILKVLKDMIYNEGPQSFFKGFIPALFLSSYGVIQMYAYENINNLMGFKSGGS